MLLLSSADFFQNKFYHHFFFRNTVRVSNDLDLDQDQHFVGPDLGPNCLQKLSAGGKSRNKLGKRKKKPSLFQDEQTKGESWNQNKLSNIFFILTISVMAILQEGLHQPSLSTL